MLCLATEDKKNLGNDYEDDDTAISRCVSRLLKYLLEGCVAKDKTVRFRVLQCIAEMISHLGEIEYVFFHYYSIRLIPFTYLVKTFMKNFDPP